MTLQNTKQRVCLITWVVVVFCFLALAAFIYYLVGRSGTVTEQRNSQNVPLDRAHLGVIETSGADQTGRILMYDKDLAFAGEKPLPYASVGAISACPVIHKSTLHAIARGTSHVPHPFSLAIDLHTFSITTHKSEINYANSIATNGRYVFTCATGLPQADQPKEAGSDDAADYTDASSYISRCDTQTGAVIKTTIPHQYVDLLVWTHHFLFAFLTPLSSDNPRSLVYQYNENLNIVATFDVSRYGFSHRHVCVDGNLLYFTNDSVNHPQSAEVIPSHDIGILNLETRELSSVRLNHPDASTIQFIDGMLYVAHFALGVGSRLSIYNPKTRKISEHTLGSSLEQILHKDQFLYVLSGRTILQYEWKTLKLIKKIEVPPMPGEQDGAYHYLSMMFPIHKK